MPCVCGSDQATVYLDEGRFDRLGATSRPFRILTCDACGLARTDPPPTFDYSAGDCIEGADDQPYEPRRLRALRRYATDGTLLDVGCKRGSLVAAASEAGFDAIGVDPDSKATGYGRELGRNLITGTTHDLSGPFDLVTSYHTLEHVLDPVDSLSEFRRLVANTGTVHVRVPHYRGWIPRLMGDRWMGWYPGQHVWHFTPRTLAAAAHQVGLRPVSITTRGMVEPTAGHPLKPVVARVSQWLGRGDQIEAVFERVVR